MDPDLLAGKLCEVCGEVATCGVVDLIDGGYVRDPETGENFWRRYAGEHSTHYFCGFHERPGKVYPRGTKPCPT